MFPVRLTRKIRLPIRQRIRFHATDLAGHPSGERPIRCGSRNFDRKFPTLHWEQPCWHPVRTARHPRVHHDPLWPKHNIPTAYLPNPSLETPPSRVCPCQLAAVDAVAFSILWATTVQFVPRLRPRGLVKKQPPESAAKQAPALWCHLSLGPVNPATEKATMPELQSRTPDVQRNADTQNSSKHDAANLSC